MAYISPARNGAFEVRESRVTSAGPRSRTLATFRELDAATIEKVIERAERAPTREELIASALRAGAPLATSPADDAARRLLRALARGEAPSPMHRRLLLEALDGDSRSAAEWLGVSADERAEALWDLLLLVDAGPVRRRPPAIDFPRLDSSR